MKRRLFTAGKDVRCAFVLAAFVAVAAWPMTAVGAGRVVLGEEFTATW